MELTDTQKATVKQWISEGATLSDVQKKLSSELGISMTYMDLRFLVIDLGAQVRDRPAAKPIQDINKTPPAEKSQPVYDLDDDASSGEPDAGKSSVSVEIDRITKPGSIVSGSVIFSDGIKATWYVDRLGRLAVAASTPGYKPTETDLRAFQEELRNQIEKRGF